ncbi:acyl-CoA N-acyltransferase [Xylariaceae sp. FL0804]|nr:acyl-CoA N-acyltransferase [Xylariaceae sp. FL0804]
MSLELVEVDPKTDFPAISRCMFESHEIPAQDFFHACFPIHGSGAQAREDAIAEGAVRLQSWHTENPTSHWNKVVDTDTGRLVGASLWNIHKEDPFAEEQQMEVSWFPDDGSRRFVEQMLEIYEKPRARVGRRPQVYLFTLFTHPDWRRRGIGQKLLNWGIKKADDMGVEMFLDSTVEGKPLYEANKFHVVEKTVIVPQNDNPDEGWKKAEEKIGHSTWWLMWRPVMGQYTEGESVKPWLKS